MLCHYSEFWNLCYFSYYKEAKWAVGSWSNDCGGPGYSLDLSKTQTVERRDKAPWNAEPHTTHDSTSYSQKYVFASTSVCLGNVARQHAGVGSTPGHWYILVLGGCSPGVPVLATLWASNLDTWIQAQVPTNFTKVHCQPPEGQRFPWKPWACWNQNEILWDSKPAMPSCLLDFHVSSICPIFWWGI